MSIAGQVNRKTPLEETCRQFGFDHNNIPRHVAVIMDGNGRWAKKRLLPRKLGHREGAEALRRAIKACVEFNIHYLSAYVFSTENWRRPQKEVDFLMKFLKEKILDEIPELNAQGVRVKFLGHLEGLSEDLQNQIKQAEGETAHNTVLQLNLMTNYGSRMEIANACQRIVEAAKTQSVQVDEQLIADNLYTAGIPDPDLLIRTGGNNIRMSNFMLWQLAYAELVFLDIFWPEFDKKLLAKVIRQYQDRIRNFGGLVTNA